MLPGAYYGHYQLTNEMVSRGTKLFSYLLTHKGEHSYTDIMGKTNFKLITKIHDSSQEYQTLVLVMPTICSTIGILS